MQAELESVIARLGALPPLEAVARLNRCAAVLSAHAAMITQQLVDAGDTGEVQAATGLAARTVRRMARYGKTITEAPVLGAAAISGDLAVEAGETIMNLLERHNGADPVMLRRAETELVNAATGPNKLNTDSIRKKARQWHYQLDPDKIERDERSALENRSIRLGETRNGLVSLNGRLTPAVAALVQRSIDACIISPKTRTEGNPSQRRHDAFAAALSCKDLPHRGGMPVTVIYEVDKNGQGYLQDHAGDLTPVSNATIQHAACAGTVQKLVTDQGGRIIELHTPQRVFNGQQRRAITVRDKGCVIPGCETPPNWCEIHHVTPHARGGPTNTDNAALLCWHHHRNINTGPWKITMKNGVPHVQRDNQRFT